jgi:hypothetical protein
MSALGRTRAVEVAVRPGKRSRQAGHPAGAAEVSVAVGKVISRYNITALRDAPTSSPLTRTARYALAAAPSAPG